MRLGAMVLAVVSMVLLAVATQHAAAQTPAHTKNKNKGTGCASGCTLSANLVCGANGVTYMGECLARCSGTSIAYRSACQPPNTDLQRQALAAGPNAKPSDLPPVDVAENPFAHDFALDLKRYPRASAADIKRYLSRGLVLAGYLTPPERLAAAGATGLANGDGSADYSESERLTAESDGLVDMRSFATFKNWAYVSNRPVLEPPAEWLGVLEPVATFSEDKPPPIAPHEEAPRRRRGLLNNATLSSSHGRRFLQARGEKFLRSQWGEVDAKAKRASAPPPLRAVGQMIFLTSIGTVYCSGVLVSPKHVLSSTACLAGRTSGGTVYRTQTVDLVINKVRDTGDRRGPFGRAVRAQTCMVARGYTNRSPEEIASDSRMRWASSAMLLCEFAEPIVNTEPSEREAVKEIYGGDGSTIYFMTAPLNPTDDTRRGAAAHGIAAVQRIHRTVGASESHFLVCTNAAGRGDDEAASAYVNDPAWYMACKAPSTMRNIISTPPHDSIGFDFYADGVTTKWPECCVRGSNGMDGGVLYRMIYDSIQSNRVVATVTGILVYREDQRKERSDPSRGDVYTAMHGAIGQWVNEVIGRPWA